MASPLELAVRFWLTHVGKPVDPQGVDYLRELFQMTWIESSIKTWEKAAEKYPIADIEKELIPAFNMGPNDENGPIEP